MLLPEITQRLRHNHQAFVALLAGMHAHELVQAPAGKWSAVQQLGIPPTNSILPADLTALNFVQKDHEEELGIDFSRATGQW